MVSAAEHALALLLALARHVSAAERSLRDGAWERERFAGIELADKTLALLGFGRIGRLVASRARALGMRTVAYDPYVTAERIAELGAERAESIEAALAVGRRRQPAPARHACHAWADRFRSALRCCDLAHCSSTPRAVPSSTRPRSSSALRSGHLAGAALDVYAQEPLPADSPLRDAPNLLLTPHLAGSTVEALDRAGVVVAEQVVAALSGRPVAHALNLPFVPEDERRVLEPFLPVAERLGRLAMALAEGPVTRIEIATAGRLANTGSRLLTSAALRGRVRLRPRQPQRCQRALDRRRAGRRGGRAAPRGRVRLHEPARRDGARPRRAHRGRDGAGRRPPRLARARARPSARDRARRPPAAAAQRRRPGHGRPRRHAARRRRHQHRQHDPLARQSPAATR